MTAPKPAATLDRAAAFALTYCAVVLTLTEYFFLPSTAYRTSLGNRPFHWPQDLRHGLVWTTSTYVFFLLLPLAFTRVAGLRWRDVGWSTAGFLKHVRVYGALFLLMAPIVIYASTRPEFAALYPFVPSARANLSTFVLWEAAYLLQFLALEAFFRGWLLFTLERRFGATAIPVAVVPYAMIHFHKPFAECLGAVVAGWALGYLALRYRSFLGGALLHAGVAFLMDALGARKSGLF
jgi:uncharacterized protein